MGKLHELLAVEGDLKGKAQHVLSQVKGLFTNGASKLIGKNRTYRQTLEGSDRQPNEVTPIATTVTAELKTVQAAMIQWIDASIQKEVTNELTKADVVIGGEKLFSDLPAPALLNLESKLAEIRSIYEAIPTNDQSEKWNFDDQNGYFVSDPRVTYSTRKVPKAFVAYEATKEHPAQVQMFTEDQQVGEWTTIITSGMLPPTEKAARLDRLDKLILAVKQARQRANDRDVIDVHVGDILFNFIDGVK